MTWQHRCLEHGISPFDVEREAKRRKEQLVLPELSLEKLADELIERHNYIKAQYEARTRPMEHYIEELKKRIEELFACNEALTNKRSQKDESYREYCYKLQIGCISRIIEQIIQEIIRYKQELAIELTEKEQEYKGVNLKQREAWILIKKQMEEFVDKYLVDTTYLLQPIEREICREPFENDSH